MTEIESAALTILLMFSMGFINIFLMKIFYYSLFLKTNYLFVIFGGMLEIILIGILLNLSFLYLAVGAFLGIVLLPIIGIAIGGFGILTVFSIFLSSLLINENLKLSLQMSWKIGKWFFILVFIIIVLYGFIYLMRIIPSIFLPFIGISSIIISSVPISVIISIGMDENTVISWRSFGFGFFSSAIAAIIHIYILSPPSFVLQ